MNNGTLSWGLVIPTYQRADVLIRCLELAMGQTRPPAEIIVVDGSPDWQTTRQRIFQTLVPAAPDMKWIVEPAARLSAAAQRNQGILQSAVDVIFLLDDDTWMYPQAAQRVMEVYEADSGHAIAGLMPLLTAIPPGAGLADSSAGHAAQAGQAGLPTHNPRAESRFKGWRRSAQKWNDWFKGPMLPPQLNHVSDRPLPNVGVAMNAVQALHGCRMTFRRNVAAKHLFDENMQYLHEETEMCLRAGADGAMVQIHEPLMFHANAAGRVAKRRGAGYRRRWMLSHAYMCRKLGGDGPAMRKFVRRYNSRMAKADFVLGLAKRDLDLWRGCRGSREDVDQIMTAPIDQYAQTYTQAINNGQ